VLLGLACLAALGVGYALALRRARTRLAAATSALARDAAATRAAAVAPSAW
jgi:hypothetical protein